MDAELSLSPAAIDALADDIADTAAHIDAATHRLLVLIREFDRGRGWAHQGALSCAHWLSWRVGLGLGPAREKVRVAHKLAELPLLDEAFRRGELSYSKLRAMTRVATSANEAELLELARHSTAAQLERICRFYVQARSQTGQDARLCEDERRWVVSRPTEDGMVSIQIRLRPDEAASIMRALELGADGGSLADGAVALAETALHGACESRASEDPVRGAPPSDPSLGDATVSEVQISEVPPKDAPLGDASLGDASPGGSEEGEAPIGRTSVRAVPLRPPVEVVIHITAAARPRLGVDNEPQGARLAVDNEPQGTRPARNNGPQPRGARARRAQRTGGRWIRRVLRRARHVVDSHARGAAPWTTSRAPQEPPSTTNRINEPTRRTGPPGQRRHAAVDAESLGHRRPVANNDAGPIAGAGDPPPEERPATSARRPASCTARGAGPTRPVRPGGQSRRSRRVSSAARLVLSLTSVASSSASSPALRILSRAWWAFSRILWPASSRASSASRPTSLVFSTALAVPRSMSSPADSAASWVFSRVRSLHPPAREAREVHSVAASRA